MDHLRNSLSLRKIILFQIDSFLILGSSYIAMAIKFNGQIPAHWLTFLEEAILVTILCQVVFFVNDLYNTERQLGLFDIIWRIVLAFGVSSLVLASFYLLYPDLQLSKGLFLYSIPISLILVCFWRALFGWFFINIWPRQNIFILGTGNLARMMAQELSSQQYSMFNLVGLLKTENQDIVGKLMGLNIWGIDSDYTRECMRNKKIDKVIVATTQRRGNFPTEFLLNCKLQGIDVVDSPRFYECLTGKILVSELRPSWLIFSSGFKQRGFYFAVKQVFDMICAVIGLIIFSPIMLIVAILIKINSPGPVLFKQERVGKNGRTFTLIKFRSMYFDAEKETGPVWAADNDVRVTSVGKVIRKLRLDELPQMINVLKGEMSFVGPRPERPFFIEKLQKVIPYYNQRLIVKPGITGWAAVKYQYSSSVESALEKLQYDLYYIKNRSLILDLMIFLKTIQVMITGKGSK